MEDFRPAHLNQVKRFLKSKNPKEKIKVYDHQQRQKYITVKTLQKYFEEWPGVPTPPKNAMYDEERLAEWIKTLRKL